MDTDLLPVKQEYEEASLLSSPTLTKSGATRASAQQKRELETFFSTGDGPYRPREEVEELSNRIGLPVVWIQSWMTRTRVSRGVQRARRPNNWKNVPTEFIKIEDDDVPTSISDGRLSKKRSLPKSRAGRLVEFDGPQSDVLPLPYSPGRLTIRLPARLPARRVDGPAPSSPPVRLVSEQGGLGTAMVSRPVASSLSGGIMSSSTDSTPPIPTPPSIPTSDTPLGASTPTSTQDSMVLEGRPREKRSDSNPYAGALQRLMQYRLSEAVGADGAPSNDSASPSADPPEFAKNSVSATPNNPRRRTVPGSTESPSTTIIPPIRLPSSRPRAKETTTTLPTDTPVRKSRKKSCNSNYDGVKMHAMPHARTPLEPISAAALGTDTVVSAPRSQASQYPTAATQEHRRPTTVNSNPLAGPPNEPPPVFQGVHTFMFDPALSPRTEEELDRLPRMHRSAPTAVSELRRMLALKSDFNTLPDHNASSTPADQILPDEDSLPPDSESFRLVPVIWDL